MFMSKFVAKDIGGKLGNYVCIDLNNLTDGWREYMRIRMEIDVKKAI